MRGSGLLIGAYAILLTGASCAPAPRATETSDSTRPGSSQPAPPAKGAVTTATLARLEGEARALAKSEGCTGARQCRIAPLGVRACGGPRDFIPYCAATTDSVALYRKHDELGAAERAYYAQEGTASTCELRVAPASTLTGGRCASAAGGRGSTPVP